MDSNKSLRTISLEFKRRTWGQASCKPKQLRRRDWRREESAMLIDLSQFGGQPHDVEKNVIESEEAGRVGCSLVGRA